MGPAGCPEEVSLLMFCTSTQNPQSSASMPCRGGLCNYCALENIYLPVLGNRLRSCVYTKMNNGVVNERACCMCRRLVALDIAVTAVAKAVSALRELQRGQADPNGAPQGALLVAAAASAPDEHSPAVKALMDIDEALVSCEAPAKVRHLS